MIESSIILGIVMALSEIFKRLNFINGKYIPLLNLAIAIALCIAYNSQGIKADVLQGFIIGLTASGVYSSTKNVIQGAKQ